MCLTKEDIQLVSSEVLSKVIRVANKPDDDKNEPKK